MGVRASEPDRVERHYTVMRSRTCADVECRSVAKSCLSNTFVVQGVTVSKGSLLPSRTIHTRTCVFEFA